MNSPFIEQWCAERDIEINCFHFEYDATFEEVNREFASEDKYNSVFLVVVRHIPTGRYFRFEDHSLPYGITDYGMDPDMGEIEEVFPREKTVTVYMTKEESEAE